MERFSTTMFIFLIFIISLDYSFCRNMTIGCFEEERGALMKFKESLLDPWHQLSSWSDNNCCSWKGVLCSRTTGHVVKLDLRHASVEGIFNGLRGREVKSCLLELSYLGYLDLSGNDFQHSSIPIFFGSMKHLWYLNLSGAGFSGKIPHHLGNLSRLHVLDLSWQKLRTNDVMWISQLSLLQHLDLSGVKLTGAKYLEKALYMLPSIGKVSLSFCGLENHHFSQAYSNSSLANVQFLDLSRNSFVGEFPQFVLNMTSLEVLDLSDNHFNSSILPLFGLRGLAHLNLADNRFSNMERGFSTFLWNKCNLKTLDVSLNQLDGHLLRSYGNSSRCWRYDLESLRLGGNNFTGSLPDKLGQLKHLKHLDLSSNNFTGAIPVSLRNLSSLTELDLSVCQLSGSIPTSLGNLTALRSLFLYDNRLNGTLPISLGKLSNLENLDVSSNFLNGVITEGHFAKLAMLKYIWISSNFLTFQVKSDWKPPFQLHQISVRSCTMEGRFPQWLQTQREINFLDFSNTSLSGPLPEWITVMNLTSLHLSDNHMDGPIPIVSSNLKSMDLSHNLFCGPLSPDMGDLMPRLERLHLAGNVLNGVIPNSLCKMRYLKALDLSGNSFSGSIPNCWNANEELQVLKLSSNRLSGSIPNSLCKMEHLIALDLSGNSFSGSIPNCLNYYGGLYVLKLSSNRLSGSIPQSICQFNSLLVFLHLNNNSFSGEFPSVLRSCSGLVVLDIGENGFSGDLPKWIGKDLQYVRALRLHNNMFTGTIPWEFCQLFELQVMDLAGNNLTGNLPSCLDKLHSMVVDELPNAVDYFLNVLRSELEYDEYMLQVFKGLELEYSKSLAFLVNLDLSNNYLAGEIPKQLTNLSGLLGLNLSHNFLTGGIPLSIGNMKSLESLDLSHNHLSSEIPRSMSKLTSLDHLNLSYNNFSGQIPTGPQLQTLDDPSIYVGNPELCGPPLEKKCDADDPSQSPPPRKQREGEGTDDVLFYITVMTGFATGFWTVVAILVFKRNWRQSLFRISDAAMERILLEKTLKLRNLKR